MSVGVWPPAYGPPLMRVMVVDRAQGKTTKALEWLFAGQHLSVNPGWSRVLVEPHAEAAKHTRKIAVDLGMGAGHASKVIISVKDLAHLAVPSSYQGSAVEFAFDNLDLMLPRCPGPVTFATMTGRAVF